MNVYISEVALFDSRGIYWFICAATYLFLQLCAAVWEKWQENIFSRNPDVFFFYVYHNNHKTQTFFSHYNCTPKYETVAPVVVGFDP